MNNSLREALLQRKAEIDAEIRELQSRIDALSTEKHKIIRAESLIFDAETGEKIEYSESDSGINYSFPSSIDQPKTIKEMALSVIKDSREGLNSNDIIESIRKRYGREVRRESLSPQLSRLKDEGMLRLKNRIWTPGA